VTFYSVTLARTIWIPDGGPRTEICRSVFNVLMCKFYICAVVGIIIEYPVRCFTDDAARLVRDGFLLAERMLVDLGPFMIYAKILDTYRTSYLV